MEEDTELLRRYVTHRANDAFTLLVQRYLPLVHSAALRQTGGNFHRAGDITQSVFTLLERKAASLCRHPAIGGWLYTTTHHTAAKACRADRRRWLREHEASAMHGDATESTGSFEWERIRPILDQAMLTLSERDRIAVLLRFFENRPFAEIGRRLGLTENAARMRVERALDALHSALAKYGISATSAALGIVLTSESVEAAPAVLLASTARAALGATTAAPGLFLMSSTTMKIAASVIVAGALAGLAVQHQAVVRLRAEIVSQQAAAQAGVRLRAEQSAALESLRVARAESAQLERQVSNLQAKLAGAPAPAVAVPPVRTLTKSATVPSNEGRSTSTAALHTTIWALNQGDTDALAQALQFGAAGRARLQESFDALPGPVREEFGTPEKFFASLLVSGGKPITAVEVTGVDEETPENVTIHTLMQGSAGGVGEQAFSLSHSPDGWRWSISTGMVKSLLIDAGVSAGPAGPGS